MCKEPGGHNNLAWQVDSKNGQLRNSLYLQCFKRRKACQGSKTWHSFALPHLFNDQASQSNQLEPDRSECQGWVTHSHCHESCRFVYTCNSFATYVSTELTLPGFLIMVDFTLSYVQVAYKLWLWWKASAIFNWTVLPKSSISYLGQSQRLYFI